jgi:putative DNA primase/helicase
MTAIPKSGREARSSDFPVGVMHDEERPYHEAGQIGQPPGTIVDAALDYASRGWKPVPISRKTKKARGKDWQKRPFDPRQFNGNADNIAVQLGAASGGLCDVDLDNTLAIGLAPEFLPPTDAIFGRRSKDVRDRAESAANAADLKASGGNVAGHTRLGEAWGQDVADTLGRWLKARALNAEVDVRPFSDDALALRFAELHANDLRYVAEWSKWLRYDGTRWQFDDTLAVFDSVRVICRAAAAECYKARTAKELASAKTVAAVERLARSDRRLAATTDQWDADLWLLNTPKGVIDLRTGGMRAHRAEDYLIHMTAVAPGGECPLWCSFLDRVTGKDKALQEYLQRVCGYALTGVTHEHALFFLYGKGANGKTTFKKAVSGILADYHRAAPIETFTATKTDRHPTELADLRGARLVTANETEEGRRWAESRINMLTGGDRVRARFMRQDLFEFTPQLKLVIDGNHKPSLRSVNEAARRRFNLIPFTVTIPKLERDLELSDKLKAEWPGILQWMIDGCVDWQERGLAPPEVVTAATTAYLDAQDTVAAWLDECCELDANTWERSQTLFASWKAFAERCGHFVGDTKTFRDRLDGRDGISHRPEPGTKRAGYQGVHLKPPEQPPVDPYYDR